MYLTIPWESGTAMLKVIKKNTTLSGVTISQPSSNWQTFSPDQMAQIFSNMVPMESRLTDVTA